jgi:hypothetical protein
MTPISRIPFAAVAALVCLVPQIALAQDGFGRRGFYLGVGGQAGIDLFEDAIEDVTGGSVTIDPTAGVSARLGYRLFSWFAIEGYYEWMNNFKTNISVGLIDGSLNYTTHTVTANLKFLIPTWRVQPYLVLGVGGQHFDLEDNVFAGLFDDKGWAFAGRPGLGLDLYITKNVVLNAEVAGVLATSEPKNIGTNITDLFYLSAGAGIQYRF